MVKRSKEKKSVMPWVRDFEESRNEIASDMTKKGNISRSLIKIYSSSGKKARVNES